MKCLECQKELIQTQGKRSKQFCNSTCRSNFWQKANRKKNASVASNKTQGSVNVQNLNKPTGTKEMPVNEPKTNETINASENNLSSFERLRRKRLGL